MPPQTLRLAMRAVYGLDQWAWIAAILGFGARYLNHAGPVLRYLTVGVFPFFLIHQTAIVVVGHHLATPGWPLAAESLALIAITFAACFATYEVARRLGWPGILLGVRPRAAGRGGLRVTRS